MGNVRDQSGSGPQDQVLSTKEISLSQGDYRAENQNETQTRERRVVVQEGQPLYRKETEWPKGKWRFIKVKADPCVRMRCLILIVCVN